MFARTVMSVPIYGLTATIWKELEGYVAKCSELEVASAGGFPSETLVSLKGPTELCLGIMLIGNLIRIKYIFSSARDSRRMES